MDMSEKHESDELSLQNGGDRDRDRDRDGDGDDANHVTPEDESNPEASVNQVTY